MREPIKIGWYQAITVLLNEYKRLKSSSVNIDRHGEEIQSIKEGLLFLCDPYDVSDGIIRESPVHDPKFNLNARPQIMNRRENEEFEAGREKVMEIHNKNERIALQALAYLKAQREY